MQIAIAEQQRDVVLQIDPVELLLIIWQRVAARLPTMVAPPILVLVIQDAGGYGGRVICGQVVAGR